MSHQARNWIIVLLVLGGILLVRGLMSSHGFGKIYVQEVEKSFVEVEVPPLVPPVMEDGVVQTPDSSAAPELVTEWWAQQTRVVLATRQLSSIGEYREAENPAGKRLPASTKQK